MMERSSTSDPQRSGVVGWFVDNPVAANLLMVLLLFAGFLSALGMRTEEFPTAEPRVVEIDIALPGASPGDVEDSIVRPVEQALIGVDGIKK